MNMKISHELDRLNKSIGCIDVAYKENKQEFTTTALKAASDITNKLDKLLTEATQPDADVVSICKEITKTLNSNEKLLDLEFDNDKSTRMFKDFIGGE